MAANPNRVSKTFGESDYRGGAMDRMVEALQLLRHESYAGSAYLAGRGVESMLRAVIWRQDLDIRLGRKTLDTGHDLQELLSEVGRLGLLKDNERDGAFRTAVAHIGRLWFNNMRFASTKKVHALWRNIGEVHKHRSIKQASNEYYDACVAVVKRCEAML